jgi:hypothetical protein
VQAYLDELVARLRDRLGERLVGAWLFGSAALGDFDPQSSDLDVQAVAGERLTVGERRELAAALDHDALPCPVRGLEFVLYAREDLDGPAPQLNLNSGPRIESRLDVEAVAGEWFWFVIDVAIGREHGRALAGPAARDVFPAPADEKIARALRTAIAWFAEHNADGTAAALAASRAWAWAVERRWLTKPQAARWAADRLGRPPRTRAERERLVGAALAELTQ